MIRFSGLRKRYGRIQALDGVDLDLGHSRVVALVGPNASGKTTLIKSLLGMVLPDAGKIFFDGDDIAGDIRYRSRIGYMPQIGRYPENMRMGSLMLMMEDLGRDRGRLNTDYSLAMAFGLPSMYSKPMGTLSGGTRQKVSAALAFLFSPEVLILDEPTAGLDPLAAEILKEKIQEARRASRLVLITSHIMSEVEEVADSIAYLVDGRLAFHKDISAIKAESGEDRLGRALYTLLGK